MTFLSSVIFPNGVVRPPARRLLAISIWSIAALLGAGIMATSVLMGPPTLATMSRSWLLALVGCLVVVALWWLAYLFVFARLGGSTWQRRLPPLLWPLSALSASWLSMAALGVQTVGASISPLDPELLSGYRWVAASILGVTLVLQELTLLMVALDEGARGLARRAVLRLSSFASAVLRLPRASLGRLRAHPLLALILVVGLLLRLSQIDDFHPGDMNVLLSAVYATLSWPPFGYYEAYRPQPWVYNHLPAFPLLLAPFYWLFENILHLPTAWAAKLLIAVADLAIAVLLYSQARGRWRGGLGLIVAAAWLLAPPVVGGGDHPIAPAIAFALAAVVWADRGWLCGLLLALGMATRNEVAFLVLPFLIHFTTRRGLAQSTAFLATFATALALIATPFALYDPEAFDYALRRQIQRDAATELSALSALLHPYLSSGLAAWLQLNPSVLAIGLNLLIGLLAFRDGRLERVLLISATGYLLTLPVVHERYTLFAFGVALLYVARQRAWLATAYCAIVTVSLLSPLRPYAPLVLLLGLVLGALLAPDHDDGRGPGNSTGGINPEEESG